MMKTGKPALQGAKASGSSVDSSLAHSNTSLEVPPSTQSSQVKSKLNRFKIITSILKQGSSTASPRPPEASNGLPNGLLSPVSDESPSEKSSQRRNFPKDITDFGLFPKRHWSGNEDASGAGEISRQMYSLSEEAAESGGSDPEDKEHRAKEKGEEGLLETQAEEETVVNEALKEDGEISNADNSSDEGGGKTNREKEQREFTLQ